MHSVYINAGMVSVALCSGARMPHWAFGCVNCTKSFGHIRILSDNAVNHFLPLKPDVEPAVYDCPHCGHKATYGRADFIYTH
jgi:DNA-directed RNA polymerase subunit RPC12/RpoP